MPGQKQFQAMNEGINLPTKPTNTTFEIVTRFPRHNVIQARQCFAPGDRLETACHFSRQGRSDAAIQQLQALVWIAPSAEFQKYRQHYLQNLHLARRHKMNRLRDSKSPKSKAKQERYMLYLTQ
ncbi:hypothetical protein [Rhodoblastus sp.]|uniref:hypothetical protein n=1 Tax=Rhodoblastus sp. TaxID=1962975 RepID=UPI003F9C6C18